MVKKILVPMVLLLAISLILVGCSSSTPSPATSAAPATTSAAPLKTSSAPPPTAVAQSSPKILKVGLIGWMGWPLGIDMLHGVQIMADADNASGGISIGGEKYQIQPIFYDSKNDQPTTVAAANKLIFEDKVNFIISDSQFADAWFPIADSNKIIAIIQAVSNEFANPKYNYVFDGSSWVAQNVILPGWYAKNHPDKNNIVIALPDNQSGHSQGPIFQASYDAFKWKSQIIYYPAGQQDQSALATRVKTINPDVFSAVAGGSVGDALVYKAVYQAGYRGQFFASNTAPYITEVTLVPPEALEGKIGYAWPVEFDNPPTPQSKAFKDAYIAKYGKWDGPSISCLSNYSLLRAALQQTGTLNTDKVAAAISNGLKYEGPTGVFQMISRPDFNNSRTVDSVASYYVKQIQGGKPVQIASINMDEGMTFFRTVYK